MPSTPALMKLPREYLERPVAWDLPPLERANPLCSPLFDSIHVFKIWGSKNWSWPYMCWKASLYVSVSQSSLGLPGRLLSIERGRSPSAANVTWFKGSALLLLSMCPRSFNFFFLQVSPKGSKWHPCSCLISSYIFRLVCSRSMKVGGFLRIRRNVLFWKALSLEISFWVSCIHSKP